VLPRRAGPEHDNAEAAVVSVQCPSGHNEHTFSNQLLEIGEVLPGLFLPRLRWPGLQHPIPDWL